MNQQQRKYALERVTTIKQQKIQGAKDKYITKGNRLSGTERLKALKAGEFTVNPKVRSITDYQDIHSVLIFDGESETVENTEALSKAKTTLESEANKVADQIMLGDAQAALRLIEAFSSKEV